MENAASRFGQRLAHTEKKYRDQALKKLTLYLTKRAQWSDLEWDKMWKALFYCMWMSDKRPIQDELSTHLANLLHKIPSEDNAMGFLHSFFRTMHREWHGIDGLRLDKFYALIRKFVHQSFVLLQHLEWETDAVQRVASMLSSEIISQLPNGLRLHLADIFMAELHAAVAESIDTDSFLLLLEPFFTLLSSEYDKPVFKRVRELIFLPLLNTYKFGPATEKEDVKMKDDEGETDDEGASDDEPEHRFPNVELAPIQHRIFAIASADDTAERNRSVLYDLYSQFFALTKVDSLKATQEDASVGQKPKPSKKRKAREVETPNSSADAVSAPEDSGKPKKSKKKKAKRAAEPVTEDLSNTTKEASATPEKKTTTPEKKAKKAKVETTSPVTAAKTPANTPVKTKSELTRTRKTKTSEDVVEEAANALAKVSTSEKQPKASKKSKTKSSEPASAIAKEQSNSVVVRSGIKLPRCAGCGGFGKGLVPTGKDRCRHCERISKQQKQQKQTQQKKRRAADVEAEAAATEALSSKKVRFGKSKAIPHELSVKRLKASAKKQTTIKESSSSRGVLKTTTTTTTKTKSKTTSRKKAADFF